MINNDILRRVRYTFDFTDTKMLDLFALGGLKLTHGVISNFLKKVDHPDFQSCSDSQMTSFLDGLINDKRGKIEGAQAKAEKVLTNNIILRKLIIALNLKAEDTLKIMDLADFQISKHELSAFFRKVGHRHYRECPDQTLYCFLKGLQLKYRKDI